MAHRMFVDGLGGAASLGGDALMDASPMDVSNAKVWYVCSYTGTDSAGFGTDRNRPFATLSYCIVSGGISNGDIVVLLATHYESIGATVNITTNENVFIGEGTGTNRPTLSMGGAAQLTLTGNGLQFRNILFDERRSPPTTPRLFMPTSTNSIPHELINCEFRFGDNDVWQPANPQYTAGLYFGATAGGGYIRIEDCLFVVTTTNVAARPGPSIMVAAGTYGRPVFRNTAFDGGTVGWFNYAANLADGGGRSVVRAESLSLLRGSDIKMDSASIAWVDVNLATGSGRVDWV